ncbi:hypothetical protein [Desulfovibrio desulfuricans]|uniref:hypothetical protein n=1 Tax=Desulfovibrio desulfuricans TaxID=876 RepID=UPI00131ADF73|nr:hypothetical protein [Desulfovibrio desulfuricans]
MASRSLISYTPRAVQGDTQFSSVGRSSGIPLAAQTHDTVTPAIIARAGAQLGKGLIDYGEGHERQQAVTLALDTMQQAEKDYSTFENDYMQKKRRKEAETAPQDFEQWMQTTGAKYGEQLQGNSLAANLFNLQWGRRSIEAVRQGGHYARQQNELWRGEVADGEAATLMQQAAKVDDPAQIASMRATYKTKLQEMFPGSDLTATLAKVDQRLASNLIGRAVAQDNFGKAQTLATQFRGELADSYDEVLLRIKNAQHGAEARLKAEKEMRFVGAFANDPLKGIAEISTPEGMAKYGMDAKTAISVRSMLQTQWSFNKTVEKQKNDIYVTSTVNGIYSTLMGDPDKGIAPDPAKAYQDLQNSNLDAITKIEMGKKLEEGTIGKTRDPAAVNDMARQIVNGSIDSDAPIDVMLAQGKASVGDVTMLKGMRKDMDGPLKDYLKRADSLIKNAYARSQFAAGTPEAAIKEDRARSQLSTVITEAYKKGGPEAVEKLFNSDTPMSIMNSNAITVDDALSNVNRVISAGGAGKEKKPKEGIADNLKRNPIGGAE